MHLMTEFIKDELERRGYEVEISNYSYSKWTTWERLWINGTHELSVSTFKDQIFKYKAAGISCFIGYCLEDPNFDPEEFIDKTLRSFPCIS